MNTLSEDFSLLSLNAFGIPFFLSWGRLARLADFLERLKPTVICLQEIQQNAYISRLDECLPSYPHRAIFPFIYAPKGGVGTFSRLPLDWRRFSPYRDRGLRWLITFSDWALYKGVLVTRLTINGVEVLILNTHLNANYSGNWNPQNPLAKVQHRQIQQLTRLMEELPEEALIILCGDFNFPRSSYLYEKLISQNGLLDPLRDDPRPTYRPFPLVSFRWNISLDYLLLRIPEDLDCHYQADIVTLEDSNHKDSVRRFLTDHRALTLNIKMRTRL